MDLIEAISLLELTSYADASDLRKAFHTLAHRYHPDKNPDEQAAEHFRRILDAYDFCLERDGDLLRHFEAVSPPKAERPRSSHGPEMRTSPVTNTADIFEEVFGYGSSGRILGYQEPQPIELTLSELANGVVKTQKMVAYRRCPDCVGVGAKKGTSAKICRYCFGQGIIRKKGQERSVCPQCHGRGRKVVDPCERCNGFGRLREVRAQRVSLPVGMRPNQLYALESIDVATGQPGQVFLEPRLRRDPVFQIESFDLLCEYHLDLKQVTQDRPVRIETPLGKASATIPAGSCHGDVVTVAAAGLYKDAAKNGRGDLRVRLVHKKPPLLTRAWRRLFCKS